MTAKATGKAHGYDAERAVRLGKSVLGCLLEAPALWKEGSRLDADDFVLANQQQIFSAMAFLHEHEYAADLASVHAQLGEAFDAGDLSAVVDGAVPENFKSYVRQLRQCTRDREFRHLLEQMAEASTVEDRVAMLDRMREALQPADDGQNWRGIFHTYQEFETAPPLRFAIDGFLQESGVTLIGGLSGHGKTLLMLAMAKALLEELPLFGHELFTVPRPARRVLYLIPESSLGPFWSRLQLFRLQEHVRSDRLLVRTLSSRGQVSLGDPRLLKAVEGADVFLDTAVRFMDGSENDVEGARPFADTLFRLLNAGARSITGAHHAPKGFEGQDYMTLENILRGSGDLGAMLCTCWGVRQIDVARNQLYIQNVKPRDFQPCASFILEGRPHLDVTGQFKMIADPGEAEELRSYRRQKGGAGRADTTDKDEKLSQAVELRARGRGVREIAKTVGVGKSTVDRWLFAYDASQECPTVGHFRDKAEPDGETANKC
jgi:AAA domain/DnaB-like helicase N terminal domain/Homeodomain-like domain